MAQIVKGTNMVLAIIPLGSGNGLARHMGIPLQIKQALHVIQYGQIKTVDACKVNDTDFFCTSGMGFDALVSQLFAQSKRRGLFTYVQLTMSRFFSYQPQEYTLTIDGQEMVRKAFLITVANCAQYGNDAFIAPTASTTDGLLDVVILKPFKLYQVAFIAMAILQKRLHLTSYAEMFKASDVKITRTESAPVHFDGEPTVMPAALHYTITPGTVKILVP